MVRGRGLDMTGQSVLLQVGGCQAGLIRGGEEVADALFRQLAVLVVVEGLAWELAEEGWAWCADAADGRRTDEPLCAAARWRTEEHHEKMSLQRMKTNQSHMINDSPTFSTWPLCACAQTSPAHLTPEPSHCLSGCPVDTQKPYRCWHLSANKLCVYLRS